MSKRSRRPIKPQTELATTPEPTVVAVDNDPPRRSNVSLADIRATALQSQTETAHTIADLEAWRAEIDCTIAFLRAQKR